MKGGAGRSRSSDVAVSGGLWLDANVQRRCPDCAANVVGKVSRTGHDSEKDRSVLWTELPASELNPDPPSNKIRFICILPVRSKIWTMIVFFQCFFTLWMQVPGVINRLIAITLRLVSSPCSWYQSAADLRRRKLDRRLDLPGCRCCCKHA